MTPLLAFAVGALVLLFVAVLLAVAYDVENSPKVKKTALRGSTITLLIDARGQEARVADWLNEFKKERLSHVDCVFIVRHTRGLQSRPKKSGAVLYRPRKGDEQEVMRRAYSQSQQGAIVITMPVSISPRRRFLTRLVRVVRQEKDRAVHYSSTMIQSDMSVSGFTIYLSEAIIGELKCIVSMLKSPVVVRRSWQAAYLAEDFLSEQPLVYYYDARAGVSCSSTVTKPQRTGLLVTGSIVIATLLLAAKGIPLPLILAWAAYTIAALVAFLFSLQKRNWWSLMAIPAFYFLIVPATLIKRLASAH